MVLLLVSGLFVATGSYAQDSPHWSKTMCQTCHENAGPVDGSADLKIADAEELCESCHGDRGNAKPCRHGSGLAVGDLVISESLQSSLKDGRVVCSTCHDTVYQCKNARIGYSYQNPGFLRDPPVREVGSYCMKCHDATEYAALNPHEGVAGNPPKATCKLCHQEIPKSGATGEIKVAYNMEHDLNDTCLGCHNVAPHPRNMFSSKTLDEWIHLVAPSPKIKTKMEVAEAAGITLPLNPQTGEIFCGTCHNQHGFMAEAPDQQPEHRLRANEICQVCHEK